jgi:hypothetical protein
VITRAGVLTARARAAERCGVRLVNVADKCSRERRSTPQETTKKVSSVGSVASGMTMPAASPLLR